MTITSPEYLYDNSNGSSAWGASYHYKLRSQTTSFATYDLWDYNSNGGAGDWYSGTLNTGGWAIKVGIDPSDTSNYNKWIDGYTAGHQPTEVRDPIDYGGSDVILYTDAYPDPRFQFAKPTVADWISTGNNNNNGTNTEGSGDTTLSFDSNRAMTVTIDSLRDSGTYDIYQDSTLVIQLQHTLGTTTTANSTGPFLDTSEYTLRYNGTIIFYEAAVRNITKVHCNFW